jgi:hypothetical protein
VVEEEVLHQAILDQYREDQDQENREVNLIKIKEKNHKMEMETEMDTGMLNLLKIIILKCRSKIDCEFF